jgi:hypothetical protein
LFCLSSFCVFFSGICTGNLLGFLCCVLCFVCLHSVFCFSGICTGNLLGFQKNSQHSAQDTEWRQTKKRTQHTKPKRLPVQMTEKTNTECICTGNLLGFLCCVLCFVCLHSVFCFSGICTGNLLGFLYCVLTKQRTQHRNIKDCQSRCQKNQNTEWRQTKQRTQYRKPKRLPLQMFCFFCHLYW